MGKGYAMITPEQMEAMKDERGVIEDFDYIIMRDLHITQNKKADVLYRIAWEYGHSGGYYDVYLHACQLVELIR
jgi:hypothetical protein